MLANIITTSRILFSLILFFVPTTSYGFAALYLLCGITDILDGFVARKLHTESEKGARLDSIADLIFAVVYAVRILPCLSLPIWIWVWTAGIAVAKIAVIIPTSIKEHRLTIHHFPGNKLTGLLLFLLPPSICFVDVTIGAAICCTAATFAVIEESVKLIRDSLRK